MGLIGAGDSGRSISLSFSSSPTAIGGEGGAPFIDDTDGEGEGDNMRSRSRSRLARPGEEQLTSERSASTRGGLAMVEGGTGRRNGEERDEPKGVDEDDVIVLSLTSS
jgi:hypothetical protein